MPNRIIKESICASENLNKLSPGAEVLFYRLLVNCDDYGRMDARLTVLRSKCFPLKIDSIANEQIELWLNELREHELLKVYVSSNQEYLALITWENHQQIRAKRSKYPDPTNGAQPSPSDSTCNQMITDDSGCNLAHAPARFKNPIRIQSESNPNPIQGANLKSYPPEWTELRKQVFATLTERRGYPSRQAAAEAGAINSMLKEGLKPDDIIKAYDLIKAQPFWADKNLSLMKVRTDIHEVLKNGTHRANNTQVKRVLKPNEYSDPD